MHKQQASVSMPPSKLCVKWAAPPACCMEPPREMLPATNGRQAALPGGVTEAPHSRSSLATSLQVDQATHKCMSVRERKRSANDATHDRLQGAAAAGGRGGAARAGMRCAGAAAVAHRRRGVAAPGAGPAVGPHKRLPPVQQVGSRPE